MVMITYFLAFLISYNHLTEGILIRKHFEATSKCKDVYLHTANQLKWLIIENILPADWYKDHEQEFISHKYFDWLS